MLLQRLTTLEELLVAVLAERPSLSVKEISTALGKNGHHYSLRGIYKELTKLEGQEIVLKTKQVYGLRLEWIVNTLAFADAAYAKYTSAEYLSERIISSDGRLLHRFTNLRKLDLCWIQAMMALHRLYPGQAMCLWIPYQWFHLVHDYAIRQFYGALDITGQHRYHIFGSDCFLSRLALKTFPKSAKYSFADSPFSDQMNIYYSFIGDHVITAKLDAGTTKRIDELFSRVRKADDIVPGDIAQVLGGKVTASLSIEKNAAKSKKLRSQFEKFFGVLIP